MDKNEEILRLRQENSFLKDELQKLSRYKLRHILCGMRDRCYRKSHVAYKNYGGKGITICDEWMGKGGFNNFYNWAFDNGWNPLLTIDRIDSNGNYCPENCRWVDMTEQQNNRGCNHYLELNGERHTESEWARILGINIKTINGRVHMGWDDERVLTQPVIKRKPRQHR